MFLDRPAFHPFDALRAPVSRASVRARAGVLRLRTFAPKPVSPPFMHRMRGAFVLPPNSPAFSGREQGNLR
jgi:hypothetical protein